MSFSSKAKPKATESAFSERKVFDWNHIRNLVSEETNAYRKTKLILSLTQNREIESDKTSFHESEDLLREFIVLFKMEKLFPNFMMSIQESKKPDKKGKSSKKKDEIRNKNEELFIQNDLKKFSLDKNFNLCPHVNFRYEINHYLYIVFWCVEIIRGLKQNKKIKPLVILDACLSLNRMISRNKIQNHQYLEGFLSLQTRMNAFMTDEFYALLFRNPQFLVSCSFQSIDSEISLYKEQKELILDIYNHCLNDKPRLIGSQLPTGQGKTFASVVLAKMLSVRLPEKTILFACSNSLVNSQVAADSFFGDGVHLWLAKQTFVIGKDGKKMKRFLIRPHKNCYKTNWKQSYKEVNNDLKFENIFKQWFFYKRLTQRSPDIIVSDLECCLELLKHNEALGSPFLLFMDEFITTDEDAEVVASIIQEGLPKQSIIASSVLPKFEHLSTLVDKFCEKYNTTKEESCFRQSSNDIKIPCCILDKDGYVNFPHHIIDTREELNILITNMKTNPRIRRVYPAKFVYLWSKTLIEILPDELLFKNVFPNIGQITQHHTNEYVIMLLSYLEENFNHVDVFKSYKPNISDPIEEARLMTGDTYKLDVQGKTLIFCNDPSLYTQEKTQELFKDLPRFSSILKKFDLEKKAKEKAIQNLETKKSSVDTSKNTSIEKVNNIKFEIDSMEFDIPKYILLNTREHYQKFHDVHNESFPPTIRDRKVMSLDSVFHESFCDQTLYEIYSGCLCYESRLQSQHQRQLIMSIYSSSIFFIAGKEIIFGTNLPDLVNIFLPYEYANTLSTSELYQLQGRVGRNGISNFASIMTNDDQTLYKLLSCEDIFEKENIVEQKLKALEL